jgi:alcohol dehydrogenase class IV
MHHGLANALCLPTVMRFNTQRKPGLYRRIGIACAQRVMEASDADADAQTIEFITQFLKDLGLATKLREHGVKASQVNELTQQAWEDPCHQTNAVPVSKEDLRQLYLSVL